MCLPQSLVMSNGIAMLGLISINMNTSIRYRIMDKIQRLMNSIPDSWFRSNDSGGHSCGKSPQESFIRIHPKKTKKVPRSFYKKSSRYFNIIKKRVLYILIEPRSFNRKGAILKNA